MHDEEEESDPKDLPTSLKRWLAKHGYPLEMRVARVFQDARFTRIGQSEFYETENQDGKKIWREIDVAAQRAVRLHRKMHRMGKGDEVEKVVDLDMIFDFFYVVECKSTASGKKKKPWLVFTNHGAEPDDDEHRYVMSHPMSELGAQLFSSLVDEDAYSGLEFFKTRRLGYAAVQGFVEGKGEREHNEDGAYKAITSVLSAAVAKAEIRSDMFHVFRMAIPIVVITAPLFECYLNDAGDVALDECEEMAVYWKNPSGGLSERTVYIVTERALPDFLKRANAAYEALQHQESAMIRVTLQELDERVDLD